MTRGLRKPLSLCLLLLNAVTAGLFCLQIARYPAFLAYPAAKSLLSETAGLLLLYAVAAYFIGREQTQRLPAFDIAIRAGLLAAALQTVDIVVERFLTLPTPWSGIMTLCFMLGTFSCWAVAASAALRSGRTFAGSVGWAIWSAVITMTVAVLLGTAFEQFLAPTPLDQMRFWPEYIRSGSGDLRSFAVANTLDSAISHLLMAPVVAAIVGSGGALIQGLLLANKRRLSSV